MLKSSRSAIPLDPTKHSGEIPNDRQHRDCALVLGGFFVSGVPMPMIGERWREIPGYELYYAASNYGRIKSLLRTVRRGDGVRMVRERILKPGIVTSGHFIVGIHRKGVTETHKVHRLVLESFIGPCPPGMGACHDDGDPSNNRLDNLRWDTHQANMDDKIRHGTLAKGERQGLAKLTDEKVREIRARLAKGELQYEIAAAYGVCKTSISFIKAGKTWRHATEEA